MIARDASISTVAPVAPLAAPAADAVRALAVRFAREATDLARHTGGLNLPSLAMLQARLGDLADVVRIGGGRVPRCGSLEDLVRIHCAQLLAALGPEAKA